jgi:hypothetical protein
MGGSTAMYGKFCERLLLTGYQWSPVIGGSGYIGILNANCAMLFLIILALELRKGFFSNRVAQDWNNVPSDIKNILVTGQFRSAYRKMRAAARRP